MSWLLTANSLVPEQEEEAGMVRADHGGEVSSDCSGMITSLQGACTVELDSPASQSWLLLNLPLSTRSLRELLVIFPSLRGEHTLVCHRQCLTYLMVTADC